MSVSQKYIDLLTSTGNCISLSDFHKKNSGIALRHDIDYDLDLALEFAHLEHAMGHQATYFLLDTTEYWHKADFIDKALQIQDFGHEIGLHVNSLAKWAAGQCSSPEYDFKSNIAYLRDSGLKISGIAAHGDPNCYNYNISNYWMFSDLKPEDPFEAENGITAEGIFDRATKRTLTYPKNHIVKNHLGEQIELWKTSMRASGVQYHATHIKSNNYFSDSGGKWRNDLNPTERPLTGSTQLLIHPEHWKGEKKVFFFLSPARSSSKWLSQILNAATSCKSEHEFTLNYDSTGTQKYKHTKTTFQKIQSDTNLTSQKLLDAAEYVQATPNDWAECNVYLPHLLEDLKRVFPSATYVYLKREPKMIVNSLINRGWYDTPNDYIHPIIDFEKYGASSQIQRCLTYVLDTQRVIDSHTEHTLFQDKLVKDFAYFKSEIERLGIAVYPRLAQKIFNEKVNTNENQIFHSPSEWTDKMKAEYDVIYEIFQTQKYKKKIRIKKIKKHNIAKYGYRHWIQLFTSFVLLNNHRKSHTDRKKVKFNSKNLLINQHLSSLEIVTKENVNSYFSFGGANWYDLDPDSGFIIDNTLHFEGQLILQSKENIIVSIYCIFYDNHKQLIKRSLYTGPADGEPIKFSFAPAKNALKFDIFCYFKKYECKVNISLSQFELFKYS